MIVGENGDALEPEKGKDEAKEKERRAKANNVGVKQLKGPTLRGAITSKKVNTMNMRNEINKAKDVLKDEDIGWKIVGSEPIGREVGKIVKRLIFWKKLARRLGQVTKYSVSEISVYM